ncbi:MAG: rod shape-determining protein MreC [Bacteroidetes bacterium]|nr:rod shape-determining protein MreC [Bacteroidota bacterium]
MFNLLQLFIKLSGFLVFVVLEAICFSLVVKYNQRQEKVYVNTVNQLTGYLQSKTAATVQYFQLYDENKRLSKENAHLLDRLANVGINVQNPLDTAWADTLHPKYTFLDAQVIKNSINQNHNYLVLNKGSKDGITSHSGVVTDDGVVGIVRKVSKHFSVAMSILHRQTKISARIRNKNYFGPLVWKSTDIHTFNLEDIPKHAPVTKGDTVETSGYSAIFPPGIMLGVVDKLWMDPGSNFFTIEVKSSLKMSNIQHVYIVRNIFKEEQEQLEQSVIQQDE